MEKFGVKIALIKGDALDFTHNKVKLLIVKWSRALSPFSLISYPHSHIFRSSIGYIFFLEVKRRKKEMFQELNWTRPRLWETECSLRSTKVRMIDLNVK